MELRLGFPQATAAAPRPRARMPQASSKAMRISARLENEGYGSYFEAAQERASLRFQETLRPGRHIRRYHITRSFIYPLFVDPYIRCLLPPDIQVDVDRGVHQHCLATKFIDDKLLSSIERTDGLRQIVLLTDGMDTRPYRLKWPPSTTLFLVSPERIFRRSIQKLQAVGAKIPRSCLFHHIPSETSNIEQVLRSKGFSGARPSLWVLQGLPLVTLNYLKDVLGVVNNLTMKGCSLFGELPGWLVTSESGFKPTTGKWMDKIFMSHGLRVGIIKCAEIARKLGREYVVDNFENALFVAEQLQFSDDQMEIWRREWQRMEEEGDEEGFEEL